MTAPKSFHCFEVNFSASLDTTTIHEEVDIKQEEAYKDEEEMQCPLVVNIKEELREEEYEEQEDVAEPLMPVYVERTPKEILPRAAMVVVPGRPVEYSEGFVEENITVIRPAKRPKPSSKRGGCSSYLVSTVYSCKDCFMCYTSEEDLKQHIQRGCRSRVDRSGDDIVHRCPNCPLCFTNPKFLAGHVRRGCRYRPTPINNAYLCIICGEGFNNYGDLYQHKQQNHDQTATDEPVSVAVQKYPHTVEAPQTFQCPHCTRTFTAARFLMLHQKSHPRQQTTFL